MPRYIANVTMLTYDSQKCVGCRLCTIVCPHGVFAMEETKAAITDRDLCMECGACARNCPSGAIRVRAGVGCASGIIMGALGRQGDCCCPVEE